MSTAQMSLKDVQIGDSFWSRVQRLVRESVIPYQWEALNDRIPGAEPSGAIRNLRIAAGREAGEFYGMVFQDSDVGKWLEAAAYSLETHPDAELEKTVDEVVDLLAEAQGEDGYLNTYFTVKEPGGRWTNLWECHELYCAGHLLEGAVAYFRATGKRKYLDVMRRYADYICEVFGPGEHQFHGYDGHEEIEMALVKLYRATGERKYLDQALYFINERGKRPYFFDAEWEKRGRTSHWQGKAVSAPSTRATYNQAHLPVREQKTAEGHAVRAVYLYSAMADLAAETGDEGLLEACRALWGNIVTRRMYLTGGIGSMAQDEAFSMDYDLPNDTVYAETCASVGLVFFAHRMLALEPDSSYADVMERALYNTVLAGMSQDGRRFFYVNPLEVWPEAGLKNANRRHVLTTRPPWFGCACCPPNVARLLASLGQYLYTVKGSTVYAHLYAGSVAKVTVNGRPVGLRQTTNYPLEGLVRLEVTGSAAGEFTIALRVPGWCGGAELRVNGQQISLPSVMERGYALLTRPWRKGDNIELMLPMQPQRMQANPAVRADIGRVALQCGPFVYCLEEADNGAGLHEVTLPRSSALKLTRDDELFGGANVIYADGQRPQSGGWGETLYRPVRAEERRPVRLKFVPYYLWANRQPGEMTVWVREG